MRKPIAPTSDYVDFDFCDGLYTGSDSMLDGVAGRDLVIALVGCAIGVLLLLLYGLGLADYLKSGAEWKPILVRVLGSWVVAVAVLVIVLNAYSPSMSNAL
ncbi:hypothetical protein [Vibrio variabilis]|uniref:hypothetical protein n=1 Tax=Vibrio variabilis TaxID=990271 RepID=UPI001EFA27F0|nr:hypothetical protein [Vibrio variabilis]